MTAIDVTFHIGVGPSVGAFAFVHAGDRGCYWLGFRISGAVCTLVGDTRGCGDPITVKGQGWAGLRA